MSISTVATCDSCGTQAPADNSDLPPTDWKILSSTTQVYSNGYQHDVVHLCSWRCVKNYALAQVWSPKEEQS